MILRTFLNARDDAIMEKDKMKSIWKMLRGNRRSRKQRTAHGKPVFENLEPRLLLNAVPYIQDFSLGKPDAAAGWDYYSDNEGRIEVVSGRLQMDDTAGNSIYSSNEAILHVDLTGKTGVTLTLDHRSLADENDALPDSFAGRYKGDGIALSVDGLNWVKVTDLTIDFTNQSFKLDSALEQAKIAANSADVSDVQIKFQQYDNYSASTDGRQFDNIKIQSITVVAQAVPYLQDFTLGKPDAAAGWEYYSDSEGRIQVVSGRLRMDDIAGNGTYSSNEAILHVNLTNKTGVTLTLDHWNLNDENDPLPASFFDQYKGDGISLSVDGQNWVKVTDLTVNFTNKLFNLDGIIQQAKTAAGSTDLSNVRIKFQQYDNYSATTDGREFDNIVVNFGVNQAPIISSVTASPSTISDTQTSQLQVISYDPDSGPNPLTYTWSVPTGAGSLNNPNIVNPIYTPPDVSATQTFTLTVKVSDGAAITSKTVDITVTNTVPDIIYVDDNATAGADNGLSWANAFIYLQDALDFADSSGGQVSKIWVAQGIYKPDQGAAVVSGDRYASFQLLNGVAVMGGYAGLGTPDPNARNVVLYETILSGDLNGDDGPGFVNYGENSYHVVQGSGTDATAILAGFTITSGSATGSLAFANDSGGGVYCLGGSPILINNTFSANLAMRGGGMFSYSSTTILINCTFSGNFAVYDGGGMYNILSTPILINSTFNGNYAGEFGGGMCNLYYSNPTLISTTFSGNVAKYGGGMANYINSTPVLINSTFSGNFAIYFGGGMHNQTESSPVLVNCIFKGNFANNFGGGMSNFQNSSPTLMNSTFSGNVASYGGGMFNYLSSNPTLTNSTFSGNFAIFYVGGMFNYSSNPTITNSIFWLNEDSGGTNQSAQIFGGTPVVNYSCIQGWTGGFGGTGNIGDDPMFVRNPDDGGDGWGVGGNDDYGDLRLSSGSPCIDAGNNTAVPPDVYDIDGDSNTTERTPLDLDGISRFIDDLLTVDTGLPDLPNYPYIVDMGAYEYHP